MKITGFTTRVTWASPDRSWLFVQVNTDTGLVGHGEASQSRNDLGVVEEIRRLETKYVGGDPLDLIARRQGLLEWPYIGRTLFAAVSAIEQALWDLCGKQLGVPVYKLLGGAAGHRVRGYANIGYAAAARTPEALAQAAVRAVEDGFDAIKFYPFGMRPAAMAAAEEKRWIEAGIECVRTVRAAVGDEVDILLDLMHQFVDFKQVRNMLQRMDALNLFWVEDPFVCDHPTQLAELRQAIGPRLAGGAPLLWRHEWRPLLEAGALDVMMPDVKWMGGIHAVQKLAAVADLFGVQVSPHNASGPVATAACVHVSLNIPNFSMLEYAWGVPGWRGELCRGTESLQRGYFSAPEAPGLGVELDAEVAAAHALLPQTGAAGPLPGIALPLN